MKMRVVTFWMEIRSSYWFIPAAMAISAAALSAITVHLDRTSQDTWVGQLGFIWSGGPDGARGLLSTVAGSMVTVTGLTFSITMVAFTQAASQYGPRLLDSLMHDTGNQIVIGTFTATFIYSLLVLRTIRSEDAGLFVPRLSVTLGVFLSLASLGLLIYFIHHATVSLQAHHLVAEVAEDLFGTINRLYPRNEAYEREERRQERLATVGTETADRAEGGSPVPAAAGGYVQTVDVDRLMRIATEHDLLIVVQRALGRFVAEGQPLATLTPRDRVTEEVVGAVRGAFSLGRRRTHVQDVEFGVSQLTEIAVRSLSPSINDPVTAMTCLDWLGAALSTLSERILAAPLRFDDRDTLRVAAVEAPSFPGLLSEAFGQIRRNARDSVPVILHMLETLRVIASATDRSDYLQALRGEATLVERTAQSLPDEHDRQAVRARLRELFAAELGRGRESA